MKSVFCHGFPGAKNTSIRASVRFVGKADKPCARRGCSAEKSQRDFFDGLTRRSLCERRVLICVLLLLGELGSLLIGLTLLRTLLRLCKLGAGA